eukprot:4092195-Amphidinium_carterae.1
MGEGQNVRKDSPQSTRKRQEGETPDMLGPGLRFVGCSDVLELVGRGIVNLQVILWKFDPASKQFQCLNKLKDDMPGAIFNLAVLGENLLFIGGVRRLPSCSKDIHH